MTQLEIGDAIIVYDDPDEGTVERTVDNERIAYFQDHWILKLDEDEAGNDIVRRIPRQRVHYVERSVEQFEDEVKTIRNQVQSFAKEVQSTLLGSEGQSTLLGSDDDADRTESHRIDVDEGTDDGSRGG